ncbi:MAG: response regulator [Clostridiales bacterium]|nr:response regulator [Clostridiales bacterium]
MGKRSDENDYRQSSNLMLLVSFTIFTVLLVSESIILGWEAWGLVLIIAAVIAGWILHIRNVGSLRTRIWIYAVLMMCTFFFYGVHNSSTFDLAIVMGAVMALFTQTREKGLIRFCMATYYATMLYEVVMMIITGDEFNILIITRLLLHLGLIAMIGWFLMTIIDKWDQVESKSEDEIRELTESTERLNDFLANVSHEIRTPVNAVIGLSGVCIDKEEKEEIRTDLMAIRTAGRKVGEQISDILDYSEIDRKKAVKNCEDFMLSSVMHDIVAELRETKKDDLELVIDVDPAIPAVMNTDVSKLKKILKALISNGLKYTKDGGVYVKMTSEKHKYGVNLNIEVTDTGIGMSDEELENIFDKYYQADSGRARQGSGLGLGLVIVSGFVAILGGFLTIKSRPGEGTTVRVSLPMKVIDGSSCMSVSDPGKLSLAAFLHFDKFSNPQVREFYNHSVFNIVKGLGVHMHRVDNPDSLRKLDDSVTLSHLFVGQEEYMADQDYIESLTDKMIVVVVAKKDFTLPSDSGARIMEKPFYCFPVVSVLNANLNGKKSGEGHMIISNVHCLVVDDEPMNLIVAKSIFKRYGMEVSTVNSGPEAIDACREETFDLIFMDHMMGGMDGVEAMKRIRADVKGLNHNAPVIALTANAMSSARQMFMNEGFDGFISKPIETEEMERVLRRILPQSCISYTQLLPDSAAPEKGAATAAEDKPTTLRGKLRQGNIELETGLKYCAGDVEFYKTLLEQVATESFDKIPSLKNFYDKKDWKNYEIVIHAVKSTSKTIGAMTLSGDALELEMAAKNNDEDYINANHQRVMTEFEDVRDTIISALDLKIGPSSGEGGSVDDGVLEFSPSEPSDSKDDEIFEFLPEDGKEGI